MKKSEIPCQHVENTKKGDKASISADERYEEQPKVVDRVQRKALTHTVQKGDKKIDEVT